MNQAGRTATVSGRQEFVFTQREVKLQKATGNSPRPAAGFAQRAQAMHSHGAPY